MRNGHLLSIILLVACSIPPIQSQAQDLTEERALDLVDTVAALVATHYYDAEFIDEGWESIVEQYRGRVRNLRSPVDAPTTIDAMMKELGDSHCGFGHLDDVARASSPYLFAQGSIGLDLRLQDRRAIVTRVEAGSPAARAGVVRGCSLLSINGTPVDQIIESAHLRPPFTEANKKFFQTQDLLWHLFGEPGTSVTLTISTGTGPETRVSLEREPRPGGRHLFPEAPPAYLSLRVSTMPGGIHYVGFNAFQPDVTGEVISAIDAIDPLAPLILDLRGNNGGSAFAAEEILSRLYRHSTHAYDRADRGNDTSTQVGGTPNAHAGSMVVLVDEMSISAAETVAAVLQATGRAQVVCERTPGQLLWGEGFSLDGGFILVVPTGRILLPDGTMVEGRGVVPDKRVSMRPEDLLAGRDNQLQAALQTLYEMEASHR